MWGRIGIKITPTLKRTPSRARCFYHITIQYDSASPNTIVSLDRIKPEDALAGLDLAFHHPIERSPQYQFGLAPGPHTGDVKGMIAPGFTPPPILPCDQLFGMFDTHTELDQMKFRLGHAVAPLSRDSPLITP